MPTELFERLGFKRAEIVNCGMQHDLRIIALYFRGLFYRYENSKGGIPIGETLLLQEMLRRKIVAPHPLDESRAILTFRGERYAKDIVHKMIRPLLYIIFSILLATALLGL
ncbi:MAG: hypothetical protein RL767_810 [Bacteroidota bacterium]|jgi:hypothetical protein